MASPAKSLVPLWRHHSDIADQRLVVRSPRQIFGGNAVCAARINAGRCNAKSNAKSSGNRFGATEWRRSVKTLDANAGRLNVTKLASYSRGSNPEPDGLGSCFSGAVLFRRR